MDSPTFTPTTKTLVVQLEEHLDSGWRYSVVEGEAPASATLGAGGPLSDFSVGDRIEITAYAQCRPYDGCKSFSVFRNAATHALISASFGAGPADLPAFSTALGVPLDLDEACRFPVRSRCYVDEIQVLHRLIIGGDTPVTVDRHSTAQVTIGGLPYGVALGEAASATAKDFGVAAPPGCTYGEEAFWASGEVQLSLDATF